MFDAIGKSGAGEKVGIFGKDQFGGNFYSEYKKDFKQRGKETVDITSKSIPPLILIRTVHDHFELNCPKNLGDIGLILSVKEESEINSMKKASLLTVEIFGKVFKDNLMETIDADRKLKHTKMTNIIEEALKDKKKLLGVDPSNVESCYPAIIQE